MGAVAVPIADQRYPALVGRSVAEGDIAGPRAVAIAQVEAGDSRVVQADGLRLLGAEVGGDIPVCAHDQIANIRAGTGSAPAGKDKASRRGRGQRHAISRQQWYLAVGVDATGDTAGLAVHRAVARSVDHGGQLVDREGLGGRYPVDRVGHSGIIILAQFLDIALGIRISAQVVPAGSRQAGRQHDIAAARCGCANSQARKAAYLASIEVKRRIHTVIEREVQPDLECTGDFCTLIFHRERKTDVALAIRAQAGAGQGRDHQVRQIGVDLGESGRDTLVGGHGDLAGVAGFGSQTSTAPTLKGRTRSRCGGQTDHSIFRIAGLADRTAGDAVWSADNGTGTVAALDHRQAKAL